MLPGGTVGFINGVARACIHKKYMSERESSPISSVLCECGAIVAPRDQLRKMKKVILNINEKKIVRLVYRRAGTVSAFVYTWVGASEAVLSHLIPIDRHSTRRRFDISTSAAPFTYFIRFYRRRLVN